MHSSHHRECIVWVLCTARRSPQAHTPYTAYDRPCLALCVVTLCMSVPGRPCTCCMHHHSAAVHHHSAAVHHHSAAVHHLLHPAPCCHPAMHQTQLAPPPLWKDVVLRSSPTHKLTASGGQPRAAVAHPSCASTSSSSCGSCCLKLSCWCCKAQQVWRRVM
jgi:hypothetical protein